MPRREVPEKESRPSKLEGPREELVPGWPYEGMYDEGHGTSTGIGSGDTYNPALGPKDLKRKAPRKPNVRPDQKIVEHVAGSEDALGSLPEEDDEAARFIREQEEKLRKDKS